MEEEVINQIIAKLNELEETIKTETSRQPEVCRIGDLTIQSHFLRADKLVKIALKTLKDKSVEKHFFSSELKRMRGTRGFGE
ncbi:MAG: hypothetical protein KJ718_01715 [Nanoarchaeota archaeon]|nr:hypothetical protein [Nanoarchaeota archaeon]